jgi:glycyl-tRNA synthetase
MVRLDSSLLMNPQVWEASGHVSGFSDPMVDDRETPRYRADQLAVFQLEFVASDGGVETFDEILRVPGEIGKPTIPSFSRRIASG